MYNEIKQKSIKKFKEEQFLEIESPFESWKIKKSSVA